MPKQTPKQQENYVQYDIIRDEHVVFQRDYDGMIRPLHHDIKEEIKRRGILH